MKIKVINASFDEAMSKFKKEHFLPKKPNMFFRTLLRTLTIPDIKKTNFTYKKIGMERLKSDEPCLILMNHSSFIDLEIAEHIFADRPLNIVCTSDGFIGKKWLMRQIGCIPTNKFVSDMTLVKDMMYSINKLGCSVLLYPEASYSFDGTATPLPESLGKFVKTLGAPVVMVRTYGAFHRDPLYNNLQIRKVNVSADVKYLFSKEDMASLSTDEINSALKNEFSFDNFTWQYENNILIKEKFRADYLNRALYKCPCCKTEGMMEGKGVNLTCHFCGKQYELMEDGRLKVVSPGKNEEKSVTEFYHIPDWYAWERREVRKELETGTYSMEFDVDVCMMVNMNTLYRVGEGHLSHSREGFKLTGCNGKLLFIQKPLKSYSLYADYYWYELGDMICIGDKDIQYYCFPKAVKDVAAKARLATEELYKITKRAGAI